MRHLIRNAAVITVDAAGTVHDPGFVLVEGDRIAAAGPVARTPAGPFDRVTDARGGLLAPGLINLHQHVYMNLAKGLADGMRLETWTVGLSSKVRNAMEWSDHLASCRLGALEMLRTGTTTFLNHGVGRAAESAETEVATLFRAFGLRQVMAVPYQIRTPALPDHPFGPAEADADLRALHAALDDRRDDMLRLATAIECNAHHTRAGRSSDELVRAGHALARDLDLRIASHMSAGTLSMSFGFTMYKRLTGRSDVEYLHRLGVLDRRWLLIHGIHLTDEDMDLVERSGASVVYTPTSEAMRGGGIGPWVTMLGRGITCALGTDGPAVDYSVDMLEQTKATCLFQALRYGRPEAVAPDAALRMATVWAARALGMDDVIGSIEAGKRADLVLFGRERAAQQLIEDPVRALVMATHGSDARLVLVNGRPAYDAGRFGTDVDAAGIVAEARARATRILAAAGIEGRAALAWPARRERPAGERWT
ncbi:MAG: amidohydrolase family protein [Rhodobacteraceae bacterium]|nr:amidohydrolase family protein [Paracoccaceae bacterium]